LKNNNQISNSSPNNNLPKSKISNSTLIGTINPNPRILQPMGIVQSLQELARGRIGVAQFLDFTEAFPHHVDVLYISERQAAIRVTFLALIAAAFGLEYFNN